MASVVPMGGENEAGRKSVALAPDSGPGPPVEDPPKPECGGTVTDHAVCVESALDGLAVFALPGRTGWAAIGEHD